MLTGAPDPTSFLLYLGYWHTTQVTQGLCPTLQGSSTLGPFMVRDSWVCPQGPYSVGSLACPRSSLWADAALTAAWGHPNNTSRSIPHRQAALLAQRPVPPPSSDHGNIGSSGHLFFYLCPHTCLPRAGHDPRRSNPASLLAGAGASVGSPVLPNSHGAPSPFPFTPRGQTFSSILQILPKLSRIPPDRRAGNNILLRCSSGLLETVPRAAVSPSPN